MTTRLAAALAAAERGWHVFPLHPGDKRPAIRDWNSRATTNPTRIQRCWTHNPDFNVGLACGPSGLVVIDLDLPKPGQQVPADWQLPGVVDGHDVFATVCEQSGHPLPLDTHTVTTRSGGTHLYYTHPENGPQLRNTTGGTSGALGWLVDTRAHGGYVLAAGSTINHRPYTTTHDTEPAPLPAWLAQRLTPAPLPPQRPVRIDLPDDRRGRYLTAAINQQLATIATAGQGGRNTALYRSAVALGQLVAGGSLPEEDVTTTLTRAGLDAGLRPREVTRTVTSGLADGARRPRGIAA